MKVIIKVPFPTATDRVLRSPTETRQRFMTSYLPCGVTLRHSTTNITETESLIFFLFALMWLSRVPHQQKITDGRGIEVVVGISSVTIVIVAQVMYNRLDTWTRRAIQEWNDCKLEVYEQRADEKEVTLLLTRACLKRVLHSLCYKVLTIVRSV